MKKNNFAKIKFFHIAVIFTLVCLLALIMGLYSLWSYLAEYEKSNPLNYINKYIEMIQKNDFKSAMTYAKVKEDGFFTVEQYEAYVKSTLGEDVSKVKAFEKSIKDENKRRFEVKGTTDHTIGFELNRIKGGLKYHLDSYDLKQDEVNTMVYSITIPSDTQLMLNGKTIDRTKAIHLNENKIKSFETIKDNNLKPKYDVYELKGLVKKPEFSLENLSKDRYMIEEKSNGQYEVKLMLDKDKQKQYEAMAIDFSKKYANYISKDKKFGEISENFYKETEFYDAIKTFSNYWYIEHDSFAFENIESLNTVSISPDHFITEVKFDYVIKKERIVRRYPTHYRLSYVHINNNYKIANLESI